MRGEERKRAGRNRTLSVTGEEVEQLRGMVSTLSDIEQGENVLNKIIHADLLAIIDRIPNGFADLVIIDPPYNLTKDFHGMKFEAMDNGAYIGYLETWFYKVCEKLKPDGSLYLCGDWKSTSALQTVLERAGLFAVKDRKNYYFDVEAVKMRRRVIAPYRENGQPKDWECTEQGNYRSTYPSNFWDDISIPFWSMPENTDHPTQKPEKLYAKLILASSEVGDVVFDPFMGSGTAAVVAKKLNRNFCGIELNEEYCLWAAKRLLLADGNKTIQGYRDGVFWERNSGSMG